MEVDIIVECGITGMHLQLDYDNRKNLETFIRDLQAEGLGWNRVDETTRSDECQVWVDGLPELFHSIRKMSLFELGVKPDSVIKLYLSNSFGVGPGCPCSILFRGYSNHTKDGPWDSITLGDALYPMAFPFGNPEQFFHTYVDTSTVKCTIHVVQGKETYTIATDRDFQDVCQTSISKIWESMGSGFQSHQLHNSLVIFNFSGPVSHI
jgi:hypothetical protein